MEHTPLDIRNIDFGNRQLDFFLSDEKTFSKMISESLPYRTCWNAVYQTLLRIGVVERLLPGKPELFAEAQNQAVLWCPEAGGEKLESLMRVAVALNHFAEKRLTLTAGVG